MGATRKNVFDRSRSNVGNPQWGSCIEERLWTALVFVLISHARLFQGSSGNALAKTLSAPSLASSFVGKRGPVDSETQPG